MMDVLNKKTCVKRQSFTLIELLIVIGLMGALTTLILPSLTAQRDEAAAEVCDYNQAGTVRTLTQYANLYGALPDAMHTGLVAEGTAATEYTNLMDLPGKGEADGEETALPENFMRTAHTLTADQVASLQAGGLDNLAYGEGYNTVATAEALNVGIVTDEWLTDEGVPYTFNGRSLADLGVDPTGTPDGVLIPLFIAPTMDWESAYDAGNNGFVSGDDVKLNIDLEGACPIPTDGSEFKYYVAFVKAYNDGVTPAELIGTACPEDGVLHP